VRSEVLTVKKMLFFWVVTPYGLQVDTNDSGKHTASNFRFGDGYSMFLRNVGIYPQVHTHYNPEEQHRNVRLMVIATSVLVLILMAIFV
jgi:hypothetical protein